MIDQLATQKLKMTYSIPTITTSHITNTYNSKSLPWPSVASTNVIVHHFTRNCTLRKAKSKFRKKLPIMSKTIRTQTLPTKHVSSSYTYNQPCSNDNHFILQLPLTVACHCNSKKINGSTSLLFLCLVSCLNITNYTVVMPTPTNKKYKYDWNYLWL